MSFDPTNPWAWLEKAWIAVAGLLVYVWRKHQDADDKIAVRVSALESTYATRDHIKQLHEKIDVNHRQVVDLLLKR